jgi:hypothetical protein
VCPFSVTLQHVPDRELGPLLIQLAQAGFHNPVIKPVGADRGSGQAAAPARGERADLPEDWRPVRTRDGESYQWPEERDRYSRYRVFLGTTRAEGAVHKQVGARPKVRRRLPEQWIPAAAAGRVRRSRRLRRDTRARRSHPGERRGAAYVRGGRHASRRVRERFPNSDVQRACRLSRRLEQGRRGRARERRRNDAQPRPAPEPATLPGVG